MNRFPFSAFPQLESTWRAESSAPARGRTGRGTAALLLLSAILWLAGWPSFAATTFSVEENLDYPGANLRHFNIPSGDLYACVDACRKEAACVAYTWVRPGVQGPQAVCWLKKATPAARKSSCCISGVKSRRPPLVAVGRRTTAHPGLDFPGANLEHTSLERPDVELCRDRCRGRDECLAYTYVKPGVQGPAAKCYLKSSVPFSKASSCCTSGIKEYPPSALDKVSMEALTDLPGSDYRDFPLALPDPRLCAYACEFDKRCRAYTFVNPAGSAKAHCWLKSVTPPARNSRRCTSGVKTPDTGLGSPLVRGRASQEPVSCASNTTKDIFGELCGLVPSCGSLPTDTETCHKYQRQLAVGAVARPMRAASAQSFADFKVFPAQGKALAEAAMCALRELSPDFSVGTGGGKGGPLDAALPTASLAIGEISYRQRVGYLDFDPVAKSFQGYRQLSFCAPIVGCYDSVAQDFRVRLERYPVAPPIGVAPAPGGQVLALDEFYALTLDSETSTKEVKIYLEPILVPVPIGPPASVQPRFTYTAIESIVAPPMQGVSTIRRREDSATGWRTAALTDLYGADHGIAFPLIGGGDGWQSQVGLGNRAPAKRASVWKPAGTYPARPDRDLEVARSDSEKKASTEITASARLTYPDPEKLSQYLPSWMRSAAHLEFEIWVEPEARAAFSGQFDLLAANAFVPTTDIGAGEPWYGSDVTMLANASSSFGFSLKAGAKLVVKLSALLGTVTVVDWETSFEKPIIEGPTFRPASSHAYFAATGKPGASSPAYSSFRTFKTNLGSNAASQGEAYVDACLAAPKQPPLKPPKPGYSPGDPTKLFDNDFVEVPCNVCVGYNDSTPGLPASSRLGIIPSTMVPRPPGARDWWCDFPIQSGCHDVCKYSYDDGSLTFLRAPDSSLKIRNNLDGKTRTGEEVCYLKRVR